MFRSCGINSQGGYRPATWQIRAAQLKDSEAAGVFAGMNRWCLAMQKIKIKALMLNEAEWERANGSVDAEGLLFTFQEGAVDLRS